MKTNLLIAAIVCLCMATAQAAHLVQNGGGLWGQVDRYINDSDTEVPSSPVSNGSVGSLNIQREESTEYSHAGSTVLGSVGSSVYWGDDTGTAAVNLISESSCESADEEAELWTYGDIHALVPAETDGYFFTVAPDDGEMPGTPIRIQLHWYAFSGGMNGNVGASIGAFGDNVIYVMRNVLPPVSTVPSAGGVVWSMEVPPINGSTNLSETGSFVVGIGDTIGIFMGMHTQANLLGAGYAGTDLSMGMELLAGEMLPALIEYPYAPGLVYDPDQNITFLKDWATFPNPMIWSDASDAVQNFTYTSGGVTYSNWRLPATTDEQGASVGEFGYLATHYGISENYFGPFSNGLDGDYWTGPVFDRDPNPDIAYAYTFSTMFGPAQWWSSLDHEAYVVPVFDGPPKEFWCPADFDNNGIVDFKDFATFASYWLNEKPR